MADFAGAEDAAAAAHHVVAGHAARLVDDDDAGCGTHRTMAVSARPPPTDQRPSSRCSGGPDRAAGSMRIRDTKDPPHPLASTSKVMGVPRSRANAGSAETTPCRWPPWRRTGFDPSAARPAAHRSVALHRQADRVEHPVRQHAVRLGVDTHRPHRLGQPDHRAAIALAVREAAHHALGPARFALVPLRDRGRRHAELFQRHRAQCRTVTNSLRAWPPTSRSAAPPPAAG